MQRRLTRGEVLFGILVFIAIIAAIGFADTF